GGRRDRLARRARHRLAGGSREPDAAPPPRGAGRARMARPDRPATVGRGPAHRRASCLRRPLSFRTSVIRSIAAIRPATTLTPTTARSLEPVPTTSPAAPL